jgi:hypothetical protein
MKARLERILFGLLLAPPAPLAGFLGAWCLSFILLPERWIPIGALTGLLIGSLADLLFLKTLLDRLPRLTSLFWVSVLVFYAVGIFGLCMGVPVCNVALALPAGFVTGARLAHAAVGGRRIRLATRRTCLLTTGLLALVCVASAFFALTSPSTPADLQGMLGLGFTVAPAMVWGLILVGGAGLLAVNWALTVLSVRLTLRILGDPLSPAAAPVS